MAKHDCIPASLRLNRKTGEFTLSVSLDHQSVIDSAQQVIKRRFKRKSRILNKPEKVKTFLLLNMAPYEREVFSCLFLDNKHRLIAFEDIFLGSLNYTQTNGREIIKRALALNTAAVIAVHNHPSGDPEPSQQDILMTLALHKALSFVDIKLLDHFIVGADGVVSLSEQGLFDTD